jgi:hypothetical protein
MLSKQASSRHDGRAARMSTAPVLKNEDGVWIVLVVTSHGKTQEFRCATEAQARQLLTLLSARSAQ